MKILILGAGQVGTSVAVSLALEKQNDLTLVDSEASILQELQEKMDINCITGFASHPQVLMEAGCEDADLLLAITGNDEVNMIACQIAHSLFRTPFKVARLRNTEYLGVQKQLFNRQNLAINVLLSPEQLVTQHVYRLIQQPGALQVLNFADGKVQLVAIKAYRDGPLIGQKLRTIRQHIPTIETRIVAIYRHGKGMIPNGDTIIEEADEVFFLADKKDIRVVMRELRQADCPNRHLIIGGGGNIGIGLALALKKDPYRVRIIEKNPKRARYLSEQLDCLVLRGDIADEELLRQENIQNTDIFCALTNDEEANVLAAMLAKRLGARWTMALISRNAYVDLVESSTIDVAISPPLISVSAFLAHVRRGDVAAVHSLRRGAAEAIETIAHGNAAQSHVVNRCIGALKLPPDTIIGALVRGDKVLIAHDHLRIEQDDHVILFLLDKHHIPAIERLFQVGATYI